MLFSACISITMMESQTQSLPQMYSPKVLRNCLCSSIKHISISGFITHNDGTK